MDTSNFKFSGNFGDVVGSLPAMKKFHELFGKKIILYTKLNVIAYYFEDKDYDAPHPVKNTDGKNVMMNEETMKMLRPLLLAQKYIEDYRAWEDEDINVEFDNLYLDNIEVGKPHGCLNRYPFYLYPNLATDITKKWLFVPSSKKDLAKGKIIIARSRLWIHDFIKYDFLKPYQHEIKFIGTEDEHEIFCEENGLEIEYLKVTDFLMAAQAIKQSRFFMSNQTGFFQVAEGMKKPRILEKIFLSQNVIPIGKDAYDSPYQLGLQCYFELLYNQTKNI